MFFWSEEQAREHRQRAGLIDGAYLTLEQAAFGTPIGQGRLFAFDPDMV